MTQENKKLIIIDGHSLAYRAHFAMFRQGMSSREGIPTGAIFGFLNMLNKVKKEFSPGYMCVVFDSKGPTFRSQQYKDYKATRKPMPDDLRVQVPIIKDILQAMKVPIFELASYEGDDIAATVAREMEGQGIEPIIVTGDKDLLQLVSDHTKVVYTLQGISNYRVYDRETVIEKEGMTPEQVVEFKALKGDSSDNIPGIAGIGDKTAKGLLDKYGTLQGVYDHIDEISKPKMKARLVEGEKTAFMSRDLASIKRDVDIEVKAEDLKIEKPDMETLTDIYSKLDFNRFLSELRKEYDQKISTEKSPKASQVSQLAWEEIISLEGDIDGLKGDLESAEKDGLSVGLNVVHNGNRLSKPEIEEVYIAIYTVNLNSPDKDISDNNKGKIYQLKDKAIDNFIKDLAKLKLNYVGYGLKQGLYALMRNGADIHNVNLLFDVEIAEYLISPGTQGHEFENIASKYAGKEIKKGQQIQADDFFNMIYQISRQLEDILEDQKLLSVHKEIELPLIPVMASMEAYGFAVKPEILDQFAEEIDGQIADLEGEIHQLAGEDFNISSPKQLSQVLFENLDLPHGKKTKSGYSTDAETLEKIKLSHPIIEKIIEYRKLTKLSSTYVKGLVQFIGDDGRIHAEFNQAVTATGRISSSNPNMQNLPIRDSEGSKVRSAFVADGDDFILMGADYSQIELRIMAHLSQDKALLESFREGKDIHASTAARVFGIEEDQVSPLQRSHAKAVNFGIIYGIGGFGLSKQLDIGIPEANRYIKSYFAEHPSVKKYMDSQVQMARSQGYVETLSGRRRKFNYAGNNFIQKANDRMAMNTPVQGTAADIIKKAMIKVYHALSDMKSRLILQIHDELIIETHKDEIDQVSKILKEEMQKVFKLDVDLVVDIHDGKTMLDLK